MNKYKTLRSIVLFFENLLFSSWYSYQKHKQDTKKKTNWKQFKTTYCC